MTFPFSAFSSLPPELQALVFEISTDTDPKNAPNVSLVSRSAAAWVHPRVFHTIPIRGFYSLCSEQLKPPDFLRLHVKRMCLTFNASSVKEVTHILPTCNSIVDLAFWFIWPSENSIASSGTTDDALKRSIAHVLSTTHRSRVQTAPPHRTRKRPDGKVARLVHNSYPSENYLLGLVKWDIPYSRSIPPTPNRANPFLHCLDPIRTRNTRKVDLASFIEAKPSSYYRANRQRPYTYRCRDRICGGCGWRRFGRGMGGPAWGWQVEVGGRGSGEETMAQQKKKDRRGKRRRSFFVISRSHAEREMTR
ncbi:hypothetical protein BKA70DRAFT_1302230 [Coprinopsis sp. MPI-PUGE-AT-0042]|nr:hypothetical protein BKA70DRAFT_1302230 [Coprinopsis sp. MPI-PUGE-AT-0042]